MRKEFNRAMICLFESTGGGGMNIIHEMATSKATMTLYEVFLSGDPIMLTDVVERRILTEPTAYRAAKKLRELGLIKLLKKEPNRPECRGGPRRNIWMLA